MPERPSLTAPCTPRRARPWLTALAVLLIAAACSAPPPARPASAPAATQPAGGPAASAPERATAPAATAAPSRLSMRLPYTAISVAIAPWWVTVEGGYFEQEGIDPQVDYIATSTTLTQAMLAGEIAVANSGVEAMVTATLAGADFVGLASTTDRFIFRLYGSPGTTSMAALRGKRVAVTRLGTATDTVARLVLPRNGLEPDRDVSIIQVGGVPEIFAALQSGAADAGVMSPPTMFAAHAAGLPVLADMTEMDIDFHHGLVQTTRRYLAANEDAVRRVLRAYLRGIARYKQDKAFGKQAIAKYTQIDDDAILEPSWAIEDRVLARVPYPLPDALRLALEQAASAYPDAASRDPRDFYDDRLLREQEANGFVASLYR